MALALLLAFIAIPIIEIAVFIQVGGVIGLGWTIALIVLTAVLGSIALRLQGLATLSRARSLMDRGELPAKELFDGLCLVVAGALLLTPGFVTDTIGALLFLPPVRDLLRREFGRRLVVAGPGGAAGGFSAGGFSAAGPGRGPRRGGARDAGVIEGEFVEIEDPTERSAESGVNEPKR
jgi:UPF0716 protein FxsA